MTSPHLIRSLAGGGLVAIVGDVLLPFVIAAMQPGYDHVSQYMSELGAPGRAGASFLSIWWIASGVLTIGLAVGLHLGTGRARLAWAGPLMVAGFGLFTGIGSGLFPCDEGCLGETFSGRMHDHLNAVGAISQLVAPGVLWLRWRKSERWWGFRSWTVAGQVALLLSFVLFMAVGEGTHGQVGSLAGLAQRLYQGSFYLWLAVVAAGLVRASSTTTSWPSVNGSSTHAE